MIGAVRSGRAADSGARRRLARLALIGSLAIAASAAFPSSAGAAGASYTVLKCHNSNRSGAEVIADTRGAYNAQNKCAQGVADWSWQLKNAGFASGGQGARLHFYAPSGTAITGYYLEHDMRSADGHNADITVINFSGGANVDYRAPNSPGGFRPANPRHGLYHAQLVIDFYCSRGGGCPASSTAHAFVRNVELYLQDARDPGFTGLSGSLLGGGWLRGSQRLVATASDVGSGLETLIAYANGTELGRVSSTCPGDLGNDYSRDLVPCPASGLLDLSRDTSHGPFQNGANTVAVRVADYAGNVSWSGDRTVNVDNLAPDVAFTNGQDPADPELIRAPISDPHSGVATGRLSYRAVGADTWQPLDTQHANGALEARIDSTSVAPGEYEFRAEAADVAGNVTDTTERENGEPMRLTFPLRSGVDLNAHLEPGGAERQTIPYGRDSHVAGRLLDAKGKPMADQRITVVEFFGDGALIRERVSETTTDGEGRWDSKLPAGPSRAVTAHFAGGQKFLPAEARAGALNVRSKASFRTSRKSVPEGSKVAFKGKVRHAGARIPVGGKLIELQVRERAGRWQTVREAFYTKPSGRYRLRYRFGRFYESDARFTFRVKVAREQDWPYKAPAKSKSRAVVVRAG